MMEHVPRNKMTKAELKLEAQLLKEVESIKTQDDIFPVIEKIFKSAVKARGLPLKVMKQFRIKVYEVHVPGKDAQVDAYVAKLRTGR